MNPLVMIQDLRFQDVLDVLFLTVFSYHLYLWFRGTKAFKALVGLLVFGAVFTAARVWGLFLTTWVFQILWQVLVILLIILFQREIRQVLERVNPLQTFGLHRMVSPAEWARGVAQAAFSLASRKTGALIILERIDNVEEHVTEGHPLESEPSLELLVGVFHKESPLHDGAMLIRGGRVNQVACYLPLTSETGLPKHWGTRHRAAIGLTERCDAFVVVVSEERGEVSLAHRGEMHSVMSADDLVQRIREAMAPSAGASTWQERGRVLLTRRWRAKAAVFGVVCAVWLALAGQQDYESRFQLPLTVHNVPEELTLVEPVTPRLHVRVRGLRKDASILSDKNVEARIDVSGAKAGRRFLSITRDNIRLPNDRVTVVHIDPSRVEFVFQRKP